MLREFEYKLYQDITDVGGFAMAKAVKTWHHQELQEAREERDTYWKERVRKEVEKLQDKEAINVENYILDKLLDNVLEK